MRAGLAPKACGTDDLRRHRSLHQVQVHRLRRGLPGGLLLRGRQHAGDSSRRMHRLRRVRAGMPGRRHQARHRAESRPMAGDQPAIFGNLAEYHDQEAGARRMPTPSCPSRTNSPNISRPTRAKGTKQFKGLSVNPMVKMPHVAAQKGPCCDRGMTFRFTKIVLLSCRNGADCRRIKHQRGVPVWAHFFF